MSLTQTEDGAAEPNGWGGRREGAGRKPKGAKAGVAHGRRPVLDGEQHPVQVLVQMGRGGKDLRAHRTYPVVREVLCQASDRLGMRIIHFSVHRARIDLIVEVEDAQTLGRAMRALTIRFARQLNRKAGHTGRIVADRYDARYLTTPSETRRALVYVLQSAVKQPAEERAQRSPPYLFHPYSSAAYFTGWSDRCEAWLPPRDAPDHPLHRQTDERPVVPPKLSLLRTGWRKAGGPIEPWERAKSA